LYHDDRNRQGGTIYDVKEQRFFPALVRRRDNDFYRRGMAIRYAVQLKIEKVDRYEHIKHEAWKAYRERLRWRGLRYKVFPQVDDLIVVSQLGTNPLCIDFSMQVGLIDTWIKAIPEGRRVSGTRGFGGKYAGSRPRSREPGRYIRLDKSLEDVIGLLYIGGVKYRKDGRGNVFLEEVDEGEGKELVSLYLRTI